ncbi:hypothetical protein EJ04DRAFT_575071 [Polyplosphaeria fusca]|uniref:DEUBAD domain-containing protein n=1 Tax=Polyplosphaeria fusca TaxID=682080 RepID=A0A9P4R4U4_9PLEO|nr:hypothetical protein EJ04DRAFT_575071 [Polyplosphaeria fusca]
MAELPVRSPAQAGRTPEFPQQTSCTLINPTIKPNNDQSPATSMSSSAASSPSASPAPTTPPHHLSTTTTKKRSRTTTPPATMGAQDRPRRARKVPERFTNPSPLKTKEPAAAPSSGVRGSKVFKADYITSHPKSRLTKTDIYHLLSSVSAWASLPPAQQQELLGLLPTTAANAALRAQGTAGPVDRPAELDQGNEAFRTDVAKFKEDLGSGYYGVKWQAEAQKAVADRAQGNFDAWKEEEAELWWGQKG